MEKVPGYLTGTGGIDISTTVMEQVPAQLWWDKFFTSCDGTSTSPVAMKKST